MADPLPTPGTTGPREITTDRAVFPRGILGPSYYNIDEVGFLFHLQPLLLDDLPQVQVPLQMVFLLGSLIDSFLVLSSAGLPIGDLESIVVVQFGHLVRVLEEVFFEVPKFLLDHGFSLVLVHFLDRGSESFGSTAVTGFCVC